MSISFKQVCLVICNRKIRLIVLMDEGEAGDKGDPGEKGRTGDYGFPGKQV